MSLHRFYRRAPWLRRAWQWIRPLLVAVATPRTPRPPLTESYPRFNPAFLRLVIANRVSRRRVTSAHGTAVISTTTYGPRLPSVHIALESVAAGSQRPARLILWLDDPAVLANLPRTLRRLQRRGLEILPSENFRVHTKYYPFVRSSEAHTHALVTCDDDLIYPRHWLRDLLAAATESPGCVVVYRAHVVHFEGRELAPYQTWVPCSTIEPSILHFPTAVSGQIIPPHLLDYLASRGEDFRQVAPNADDVWLHACAVRTGTRIRQVTPVARLFPFVPGSQVVSLNEINFHDGGNDRQIAASYTAADLDALRAAAGLG